MADEREQLRQELEQLDALPLDVEAAEDLIYRLLASES